MPDQHNMLASIDMLADQVRHAWAATAQLQLPDQYRQCQNSVLFGMGGSALGMDITRAVFADTATVPLLIENSYQLPAYVTADTLAIVSSYSGSTEETLTVARDLPQRTQLLAAITTGGELHRLSQAQHWPAYIIEPTYNPCGQPRIAVGYAVVGLLRLLSLAGIITVTDEAIDTIAHYLDGNRELLRDAARDTVQQIGDRVPVYVGSEFLLGNLHTVANQTNENGKHFSCWFSLPELNHHLLEGLGHPVASVQQLHWVLVESQLYHDRVQKRYQVTRQVLDQQSITHSTFIPTAASKLLQAFEVLQWGSYVSFYLAQHNQVDPSPIPWVDFFKHALKN